MILYLLSVIKLGLIRQFILCIWERILSENDIICFQMGMFYAC